MDITLLSEQCDVRYLNLSDIDQIYNLEKGNTTYYDFHPPFVTKESIAEDMHALPSGVTNEDKCYVGYFNDNDQVAILDLISGRPQKHVAMIGIFMMDVRYQGKGTGTALIAERMALLKSNS